MSYTQSPHLADEEIESLLKNVAVARFCSFNADGTIHAVPVWFSYIDGKIVVATPFASRKARNARSNPNVTLLVDDSETKGAWPKGVVVYGKAELEMNGLELPEFTQLCEKYRSGEEAEKYARGLLTLTKWIKIVVTPIHLASFDYNKDTVYKTATGE